MKNTGIEGLGAKELDALIRNAKARKTLLAKRKPLAVVRARLGKFVKDSGYSIEELLGRPMGGAGTTVADKPTKGARRGKAAGNGPAKRLRGKGIIPPKYRNPDNHAETWTGRGQPPKWMRPLLAQGRSKDEFLIPAPNAD